MSISVSPDHEYGTTTSSTPHLDHIVSTVKAFLRDMEYSPPDINPTNKELEAAMFAELEMHNLHVDGLKRRVPLCASLAELAYHDSDINEKKNIALTTAYLIHVDDMITKDPVPCREFEQRFIRGQPQLDPVLDTLVDMLSSMWDQYQPLCANFIITSVLEFMISSCIESELEIRPLARNAPRFPWFLRERTGAPAAYAFFMFTNSLKIDIMQYVHAIPDIVLWMSGTNDLLSFYKEELAGEKANYVHTRALVEKKTPQVVLTEMKDEMRLPRKVVSEALADSPDALKAWHVFERGYVMWHLVGDRYKLKDLEL